MNLKYNLLAFGVDAYTSCMVPLLYGKYADFSVQENLDLNDFNLKYLRSGTRY